MAEELLVDAREQGPMTDEGREWMYEQCEPSATAAGLEYTVSVYPADRAARSTVDLAARAPDGDRIEHVFVEDHEEARVCIRAR